MFIERLSKKFNVNEPILTEEIFGLFPEYSRAQVFRYIEKAKRSNVIVQFAKGVYYIPTITFWGEFSTITADSVIEKKYLRYADQTYGIYSGIKLLNNFSITTQMAAVIEIVTNNETTRCREINIGGRKFILRKSRCEINKNNYAVYTILQLFNDFTQQDRLDESSRRILLEYIKNYKVTQKQLLELSTQFPAQTTKKLIRSGIINEIA
jgi:hypothetical protein